MQKLASANYQAAALPPGVLGLADPGGNQVVISSDAAGHGWYVEPTAAQAGLSTGQEDLMTVVLHEMGHLAGLPDTGTGLMADTLPTGVSRAQALDAVFADHV
jgi:hypothetical protein